MNVSKDTNLVSTSITLHGGANIMSKKIGSTQYFPVPETPEEKLVHVLGIMKNSTMIRMKYFNYQHDQNKKYLENIIDKETGQPISKDRIYETIHVDYIFSVIQAIETLHGILYTAHATMTDRSCNLHKLRNSLINPRGELQIVHDLLSEEPLNQSAICNISAIPYLDSFKSSERTFLKRVLEPTFERIRNLCRYSQAFWDVFKPVRNVFAHNFRLIFFDEVTPSIKPATAETIVGFLEPGNVAKSNILSIGAVQLMASRELVLALAHLEINIITSVVDLVLNKLKPVLPRRLVNVSKKDAQEYVKIWNSQGYRFPDLRREGIGTSDIGVQKGLYHDFMHYAVEKMGREIIAVGQDGATRIAKFRESPQELKEKLKEKQTELRRKRHRKKKGSK